MNGLRNIQTSKRLKMLEISKVVELSMPPSLGLVREGRGTVKGTYFTDKPENSFF